jgi:hypothetical protein
MPAQVNITVENDADFYQVFQYTLADGVTPISIVGATFAFGVRRSIADPGVLFRVASTLSFAGQIQIVDGPNGKFGLWIAKAQLLAAPTGTWAQSMIITQPAAASAFPPTLSTPIWGGTLTNNNGPSR